MREVLRTFADWYKKGYLRQDFMSMDGSAVTQDLVSGKFGVQVFPQWWFAYAADMVNNNGNDSYFEAYEMPSADGKPVIHPKNFENGGYLVVNKNCKNIDAAIKCMSYMQYIITDVVAQKLMTQEQLEPFMYSESLHIMSMFKIEDATDEEKQFRQIQQAKKTGDTSIFTSSMTLVKYNYAKEWADKKDTNGIAQWLQMYADKAAYATNVKVYEQNRYINSRMIGPAPEELASYGSTLDDLLREGFTKIVIGQEPLSYFDTLVREWKSNGGDSVTAAVNKAYGNK
jgi:putative aldouronate transport system substrate-binding protein